MNSNLFIISSKRNFRPSTISYNKKNYLFQRKDNVENMLKVLKSIESKIKSMTFQLLILFLALLS